MSDKNRDYTKIFNIRINVKIKNIFLLILIIFFLFLLFKKSIFEFINDIEFKNFYNVTIEKLSSKIIVKRQNYKYSQLCDGRILITGGNLFSKHLKSTEIFDPKTKKFSKGPNMNFPHRYHRQYTTNSCDVIIADTNCFETYNSKENKFEVWENSSIKKNINSEKSNIYGSSYYFDRQNSKILITGGILYDDNNKIGKPLDSAFVANCAKKRIKKIENLPFTFYNHNTAKSDKNLIIWGGSSKFSYKYLLFDIEKEKIVIKDFGQSLYSMKNNKCFKSQKDEFICLFFHPDECDRCIFSLDYIPHKDRCINKINFNNHTIEKISVPKIIFGVESEEDATNEYISSDDNIVFLANNCNRPYLLIYSVKNNKFLKKKINKLNPKNLIRLSDNLILLIDGSGSCYLLRMEPKYVL